MRDYTNIAEVIESVYERLPTTTLTVFNPITSKGTIDTSTGTRDGGSSSASFTVVDLGDLSGSKGSIQSNEVSEREIFALSKDIPNGTGISSSTIFTLYGQEWSFASMEVPPGNVCIFLVLRKVSG